MRIGGGGWRNIMGRRGRVGGGGRRRRGRWRGDAHIRVAKLELDLWKRRWRSNCGRSDWLLLDSKRRRRRRYDSWRRWSIGRRRREGGGSDRRRRHSRSRVGRDGRGGRT